MQNALLEIDDLTRKNKALEEQLRLATAGREVGRRDTVPAGREGGECLVLGDSIVRNVRNECTDMKVECSPGIRTEQLQKVIVKRDLGSPDAVVIHVGTNELKRIENLDNIMGDAYDLINTVKTKFSTHRAVLSGMLRRRDVSWQSNGAVNGRLEWVKNILGVALL
jgi:hypothetical protein